MPTIHRNKKILHLEINGKHEYYSSAAALYERHSSLDLGISQGALNNYFSKCSQQGKECVYHNTQCIIRRGKLNAKTQNTKEFE